jgi:hypothetical protein
MSQWRNWTKKLQVSHAAPPEQELHAAGNVTQGLTVPLPVLVHLAEACLKRFRIVRDGSLSFPGGVRASRRYVQPGLTGAARDYGLDGVWLPNVKAATAST